MKGCRMTPEGSQVYRNTIECNSSTPEGSHIVTEVRSSECAFRTAKCKMINVKCKTVVAVERVSYDPRGVTGL